MAGQREVELAKLFYTIEAKTGGLHRELGNAERSLERMAQFVKAHPVAALGGLAAAAVAVGLKAAGMAERFDASVRRIAAVIPGGAQAVHGLGAAIENLAASTGKSAEELSQAGLVIGRAGLAGPEAFAKRLELVSKVADATATDMGKVAQDIDLVLDVFGLSADKAEEVAAKLVAAGKGKFEWEQLSAAIQAVAPAVQDAGLGFDEAVAFLGHWVEAGRTGKQSARELKDALKEELAGKGGDALRQFSKDGISAAEALRQLNEAAAVVASGSDRTAGVLQARWERTMRAIGRAITENALKPMRDLLVLATDPFFASGPAGTPGAGKLEGAIFDVLSGPARLAARQKAERDAALAGATGPAQLPDLIVKALTPEQQAALRDKAQAFADEVRKALAAATAALADDLALVLEEYRKRYADVYEGLTEAERRLADQRLRDLENQLRIIRNAEREAPLTPRVRPPAEQPPAVRPMTPEENAGALEEVEAGLKRINKIEQDNADAERERRQELERSVAAIQRGVRGAVQLGQAFGIVDANLAQALSAVGDMAGSLKLILGGAGGVSTWLSLAGSVTSIIGGLFGGAPTPQQLESQRIQQANTDALRAVAKVVGEWSSQLTGTAVTTALGVTTAFLDPSRRNEWSNTGPKGSTSLDRGGIDRILREQGLTLREFKDLAEEFNVEIDTSSYFNLLESLRKLDEVIKNTELTRFARTWAGQLEQLGLEFELFDITDPVEQLKRLQELALDNPTLDAAAKNVMRALGQEIPPLSDALANVVKGLDLTSQGGRTEADRRIRELFTKIQGGTLTPAELGGLTPGELEAALRELETLMDTIAQQQGELTGGGPIQATFGRESVITEATGSQITGLLLSHDVKLGDLVSLASAMLEALQALVLPPALAVGSFDRFAGPAGALAQAQRLELSAVFNVHVLGNLPEADAAATGELVGQAAAERFDAELAARYRQKQLTAGASLVAG